MKLAKNLDWVGWSLVTLVLWGVWGFLAKLASSHVDWKQQSLLWVIGAAIPIVVISFYARPVFGIQEASTWYVLASGIAAVIGNVGLYIAMGKGKASLAVPVTAVYPLVTIILSVVFLREKVTLLQSLGIFFGLIGILLMTR